MNLNLSISERAAAWLQRKARAAGGDESLVAAQLLEESADRELGLNGPTNDATPHQAPLHRWLESFRDFVARVPARPGPAVDASRESIYD
jgi:hypothetical protein